MPTEVFPHKTPVDGGRLHNTVPYEIGSLNKCASVLSLENTNKNNRLFSTSNTLLSCNGFHRYLVLGSECLGSEEIVRHRRQEGLSSLKTHVLSGLQRPSLVFNPSRQGPFLVYSELD